MPRTPEPDGHRSAPPADRIATPHARRGTPPWRAVALVAAGGSVGALARVALSAAFPPATGAVPWSTLVENVTGAALLGCLLTVLVTRAPHVAWVRPLLGTGLLGAYTTFATVGLELHLLAADGRVPLAFGYLLLTWVGGLAAGGVGIVAGRVLAGEAGR